MKYGYARTSYTKGQFEFQTQLLEKENCDEILTEIDNGGTLNRSVLNELLNKVQAGDSIVVTNITRLGRNTEDVQLLLNELAAKGVIVEILTQSGLEQLQLS